MRVILETPRLTLRQFTENVVDNLFTLNSDPEVIRYLTAGRATPREEIRDQIIPFHLAVYDQFDRLGSRVDHHRRVPGLVPLPPRPQMARSSTR